MSQAQVLWNEWLASALRSHHPALQAAHVWNCHCPSRETLVRMSHAPLLNTSNAPHFPRKQKNGKTFPIGEATLKVAFVLRVDVWMVFVPLVSFCRARVRER